ncbi:MAG TPA: HU family DNA-binding protein [Candidatus Enterocola sp.]|nr:HU family DNA-binding protein [Candidatus Enterocola sp.]
MVNEISNTTGIDKVAVMQMIESFMEEVKRSLTSKQNVYLRGFGSFVVKQRAEKVARNISKNVTITIPAHVIPSFKPAKTFIESVKK